MAEDEEGKVDDDDKKMMVPKRTKPRTLTRMTAHDWKVEIGREVVEARSAIQIQ